MADRSLMLTGSTEGPTVRCLDIATHDNVVMVVYDKALDSKLYYRVGIVDKERDTTDYGEEKVYDIGKLPSVTLIRENGKYYALATHQPGFYFSGRCFCRIRTVNVAEKEINNWKIDLEFHCPASNLKVRASSNGTVVIAHEKYYSYDKLCYHIGTLKPEAGRLDGIETCHRITEFSGVQPSLDIHDSTIVMLCRSRYQYDLKSVVGTINDERNAITWGGEISLNTTGMYPSISINSHGNVVESHKSKNSLKIMRMWGQLQDQEIKWTANSLSSAPSGRYPSLSLGDDGYVVQVQNSDNKLSCSQGRLNVRGQSPNSEGDKDQE